MDSLNDTAFDRNINLLHHIAICDDDAVFCREFKECVKTVADKLHMKYHISVWNHAADLIRYLEEKNKVDLLFLDIELDRENGVQIGKYIREKLTDYEMQVVYVSREQGYAMQLFEIEPMDFLIKPVATEQLKKVMTRFLKKQSLTGKLFAFKAEHGTEQLPYDHIYYFQSMNHKVEIHTLGGQKEFYGKLSEVESAAPDFFLRIHKSFLVNENFVSRFHYDSVILRNGEELTISKAYRNTVREYVQRKMEELYE